MAKAERVILHIGSDKTGSSSIQNFFDENREKLIDAAGVVYLPGFDHAQLGSYFCDFPESFIANIERGAGDGNQIRRDDRLFIDNLLGWAARMEACRCLVFSYEGFASLGDDALPRLREFCLTLASEVVAVYYVRPPQGYATSAMSQRARTGRIPWSPEWSVDELPVVPHRTYLQRWCRHFGTSNVVVRLFSDLTLRNGDVVADFLSLLGVPEDISTPLLVGTVRQNRGLTAPAMHLAQEIIDVLHRRHLEVPSDLFFRRIGRQLGSIAGERFCLTTRQADMITAGARPHTEYLAEAFGIAFREDAGDAGVAARGHSVDSRVMAELAQFVVDVSFGDVRADKEDSGFLLVAAAVVDRTDFLRGERLEFTVEFSLAFPVGEIELGIHIFDEFGRWAFGTNTGLLDRRWRAVEGGTYKLRWSLMADLPEGRYTVGFAFHDLTGGGYRVLAWYDRLLSFNVNIQHLTPGVGYVDVPVDVTWEGSERRVFVPCFSPAGRIDSCATIGDLVPGETFPLDVILTNLSDQTWVSTAAAPLRLAYHWSSETGETVVFDGRRSPLPVDAIMPGQSVACRMFVSAPPAPGRYWIELAALVEGKLWFDGPAFRAKSMAAEVVSVEAGRRYPAGDPRLATAAGCRSADGIVSTDTEGFLLGAVRVR